MTNAPFQTSYQDLKMTHNLEAYVQWFNHLSYVVASEVCSVSQSFHSLSCDLSQQ